MSALSSISCQSIDIDSFGDNPESVAIFHKVSEALRTGKRIIVVTGAGISVSSGIPVWFNWTNFFILGRISDLQADFMSVLVLSSMVLEAPWNSTPNPPVWCLTAKFR